MILTVTLKCLPQEHYGCLCYTVMVDLVLYSFGTPGPFVLLSVIILVFK